MNKSILGITAHPDDNVMFAGTIMKLQEKGYDYYEIVLTDSNEGGNEGQTQKEISNMRLQEMAEAAKFLNIKKVFYLHQEDQNLNYSKELMHELIKIIREVKPEIGISLSSYDVHPDHIQANILARESFRWAAKGFRSEYGEKHRTPIVMYCEGTLAFTPSFLVDITNYYSKKEELFKKYSSQASKKDLSLLESFAILRGHHLRKQSSSVLEYAEAFSVEQNLLPIIFE